MIAAGAIVETWRVIPSFPDYEASDQGRIFSRRRQRPLNAYVGTRGYLAVGLWVDSRGDNAKRAQRRERAS